MAAPYRERQNGRLLLQARRCRCIIMQMDKGGQHMAFLWCTVRVKDLDKSVKFYEDVVGLKVTRRLPGVHGDIVFMGDGETLLELMGGGAGAQGQDISIGFSVDDLDAFAERLAEKGVAVHSGPISPAPGIRFLFVQDPDGLLVQFVEQKGR
jgi:lactoylglutathione lyase